MQVVNINIFIYVCVCVYFMNIKKAHARYYVRVMASDTVHHLYQYIFFLQKSQLFPIIARWRLLICIMEVNGYFGKGYYKT